MFEKISAHSLKNWDGLPEMSSRHHFAVVVASGLGKFLIPKLKLTQKFSQSDEN